MKPQVYPTLCNLLLSSLTQSCGDAAGDGAHGHQHHADVGQW